MTQQTIVFLRKQPHFQKKSSNPSSSVSWHFGFMLYKNIKHNFAWHYFYWIWKQSGKELRFTQIMIVFVVLREFLFHSIRTKKTRSDGKEVCETKLDQLSALSARHCRERSIQRGRSSRQTVSYSIFRCSCSQEIVLNCRNKVSR